MAKRWSEEDDDLDLDLDFDREEYMKKEIIKGKSTLVAVGIAPFFSFVSMYIFNITMDWVISLIVGMLGLILLKPIYDWIDIDLDKIGKKGWIKNGGVYFMTLLAVWVILMNPPVSDFTDPEITDIGIEIYHEGEWVAQDEIEIDEDETYRIRIIAEITDNVAVDEERVEIDFERQGWESMNRTEDDHIYQFQPEGEFEPGSFMVVIRAYDVNDNRNTVETELSLEAD